jgi:hypothetical protein
MATNDNTKTAAYENYPNNPLSRMSTPLAIAGGVTLPMVIETGGFNELNLEVYMTGAADGDLIVSVFPISSTGVVGGISLTPVSSSGPKYVAPNVSYIGLYDVTGHGRVQVTVKNNGGGAGNGVVDANLS